MGNSTIKKNVLISVPNLSKTGGVSSYWNSILPELNNFTDIKIQRIEVGGNGKNIFGLINDQLRFKKKLNQNIDLVVLNPSLGFRSFFRDAFLARSLVKSKISFLVFFHGWNLDFEKSIDKNYKRFFLNSFGKANTIIVLSRDFEDKLNSWGFKGRVIVETTTLDSSLINDFSIQNKIEKINLSNKIKILFLARLEKEKGIFETINAFKEISSIHNNMELTIAGDGMVFNEVKKCVINENNISIIGYVEGQTKVDILKDNHIYCLPSYSEGLPITVLEAMAFGMPILTTKVGGLKEFIEEGKMGFFVNVKNIKDLEEKFKFFINNKNKIIEMGQYNHSYAKQNLLNIVVAKRIKKYFDKIIS